MDRIYLKFVFLVCLQSTKAVYNRILDLKISNPQIIINFAVFLEEHRYFEESFKVGCNNRRKERPFLLIFT